jgi:hypothetical protein
MLMYPGFIHFGTGSPVRGHHMDEGDGQTGTGDHMDEGDAWRNLCILKTQV